MSIRPPHGYLTCTIKGHVVDQNDRPLKDIDIEWDPFGVGLFVIIARTDKEGHYIKENFGPIPSGISTQIIKAKDQVSYPAVSPNIPVEVNFKISLSINSIRQTAVLRNP